MTKPGLERAIMTQELWVDILPWRNDPLVYVWSRTDRPISLNEHRAWFEAREHKLADEPIFSYNENNLFVGMARIDKVAEDTFEVSLLVNPNQRSGGYGKQILADACKYFLLNKSSDLKLIGMDPSGTKFLKYYPEHVKLIPDFFNAANFRKNMQNEKAKIVTSIAMFYDLEDPIQFMKEVHEILHDDGIWVFEQSYLPTMLEMNAYDTVCHEHISYYAFKQIKWMADRADFKIIDVELNDINGGSFCITVAKKSSKHEENKTRIDELIKSEEELKLSTLTPYHEFLSRVENHKKELNDFIKAETAKGKKIYGYGASTKGNVILQYCNITKNEVKGIAEVNEDKFGAFTPGTLIPIESESTIKSLNPDYLLVLPWHFRTGIIKRETPYINSGGKFVFPLPKLEIVDKNVLQNVA